jgi:hypothetical protein
MGWGGAVQKSEKLGNSTAVTATRENSQVIVGG